MSSSYSGKTIREIKSTSYEVKYEKYESKREYYFFKSTWNKISGEVKH